MDAHEGRSGQAPPTGPQPHAQAGRAPDVAEDGAAAPHGPREADAELRSLDPRVVAVWRLAAAGRALFFAAAAYGAEVALRPPVPLGALPLAALVIGIGFGIFWPPAQYRNWRFGVRERDLFVRRGVLFKIASVIPHNRIQHVDTQRGPLERALGLARVVVYTAGIRGADVTIPGLALEDAERLRDRLAALGGGDDAV